MGALSTFGSGQARAIWLASFETAIYSLSVDNFSKLCQLNLIHFAPLTEMHLI